LCATCRAVIEPFKLSVGEVFDKVIPFNVRFTVQIIDFVNLLGVISTDKPVVIKENYFLMFGAP
jgi:hypothetical protein